MANYSEVKSEKGKRQVVHDNFIYHSDGQGSLSSYWRCEKRGLCKGRGVIDMATNIFTQTKPHSHAVEAEKIERKRTVDHLKEAVKEDTIRPLQST